MRHLLFAIKRIEGKRYLRDGFFCIKRVQGRQEDSSHILYRSKLLNVISVKQDALAKLIVLSEMKGVELEELSVEEIRRIIILSI